MNEEIAVQPAALGYEHLLASFASTKTGEIIYPEYYGGAYISVDGQLNILRKRGTVMPLLTIPGDSERLVTYHECSYSYNELLAVMKKLNEFKLNSLNIPLAQRVNAFGLSDSHNRVMVYIDDIDEKAINELKTTVCDSPAIVYGQGTGRAKATVNMDAGSNLSSIGVSMGFRVKRNNIKGFLTAGHGIDSGNIYTVDGKTVAICTVSQISGSADAAFCDIVNSDYTVTNTISGTNHVLSTAISSPGVGTLINKQAAATGHTTGHVTNTNCTATFETSAGKTFTISNLTAADYDCYYGDSGGLVYSYVASSNTRYTLGICTGRDFNTGISYYTKADCINDAFATSRF